MDALRTVVVDDEQLAREELCFLLGQVEGVDVVAQAANGVEALRVIEEHRARPGHARRADAGPDGIRGRAAAAPDWRRVAARVRHRLRPARDRGLRGQRGRLPAEAGRGGTARHGRRPGPTANSVRPPGAAKPSGGELDRLLQLLAERQDRREQLAVKVADRFLLVQADEVVHASVEDDVITVVTNSLSGTSNYRTLDELQARLDPAVFWRVHRSHLVNINKIKEIVPWFSRNFILKMKDAKGTEIPVSRSQTKRLREYLRL